MILWGLLVCRWKLHTREPPKSVKKLSSAIQGLQFFDRLATDSLDEIPEES